MRASESYCRAFLWYGTFFSFFNALCTVHVFEKKRYCIICILEGNRKPLKSFFVVWDFFSIFNALCILYISMKKRILYYICNWSQQKAFEELFRGFGILFLIFNTLCIVYVNVKKGFYIAFVLEAAQTKAFICCFNIKVTILRFFFWKILQSQTL